MTSAKIRLNRQSPETTVRRPKVVWKFAQLKSIIASFYVVYVISSKKIIYPFDISPSLLYYSVVTFIRTTTYKIPQFVQNWSRGSLRTGLKVVTFPTYLNMLLPSNGYISQQFIKVNIFNNYSSNPNGLWVNRVWLRGHEGERNNRFIVKSNYSWSKISRIKKN